MIAIEAGVAAGVEEEAGIEVGEVEEAAAAAAGEEEVEEEEAIPVQIYENLNGT